jgi:hypothetical protein
VTKRPCQSLLASPSKFRGSLLVIFLVQALSLVERRYKYPSRENSSGTGKHTLQTALADRAANSTEMGPWNLAIVLSRLSQLKSIRNAALFDAGETNLAEHSSR